MPYASAVTAVLPLMVLEAVGQGVGYIGIHQLPTTSQTAGGVTSSPSRQPVWGAALDSNDAGDDSGVPYSQEGGEMENSAGSESQAVSHATSNFASHGGVEDVKHVADFQPKEQTKEQQQQQQHRVPLQNMDNVQYFGDVMVGEPPQRMKVRGILFDTGSSDTWVPGIGCTSCGLHSAFDALASTTAMPMGRNFSNRYDSGSVEGSVIKERVLIGGMAVDGVEMGLVRRQEHHIRGFKADGIVGLAFPSISTTRNTSPSRHSTFVQLLQEQFGVVGDLFSVYLTPSPNQPGSTVIFGGYDLDLVRRGTPKSNKRPQGSVYNDRTPSITASREQVAEEGRPRVWRRGKAKTHLRGSTTSQQQQQYQVYRAAVVRGGDLEGEAWTGDGGAAVAGGPFEEGGEYDWRTSVRGVEHIEGLLTPFSAPAETGLDPEGSHGEGSIARVNDGHHEEDEAAAAIESQRALGAGGRAGEGEAQHKEGAIADSGVDGDEESDEPVIVWTPVIPYRGSISYWTVQLTGWRTETTTEALDSSIDYRDRIATAVGTEQEHVYNSDEQNRHDRRNNATGVNTGHELCPAGCQAIVDTGSSLLIPPRTQYRAVMQQITGGRTDCAERHGMISCSRCSLEDFPDIVVSIAVSSGQPSRTAPWPASNSRSRGVGDVGTTSKTESQAAGGGGNGGGGKRTHQEFRLKPSDYLSQSWDGCEILIGEGRATDMWTLGDAFIKTYMTIFDVANLRVGFVCADGGRCQGGASPPWHPSTRFCLPFMGGMGDTGDSADVLEAYCLHLHHSFVGWALMLTSILLFLAGCLLRAEENISIGRSRSSGNSALLSPSSQPSEQHSPVPNPHFPFLITGQQEYQQQLQLQQQQQQQQLESSGDVLASGDDKTEAGHGGSGWGGEGGNSPLPHGLVGVTCGNVVSEIATPERRRDGHRKGGGVRGMLGWLRGSEKILLSLGVYPKVTSAPQRSPPPTPCPSGWAPSKTAHSAVHQHHLGQPWPSQGGVDGRGSSGAGATVALGTSSSDGMRSRGGTPRPGCSPALVGGVHHQNKSSRYPTVGEQEKPVLLAGHVELGACV